MSRSLIEMVLQYSSPISFVKSLLMEAPQTWAGAKVRIGGQKQFTIHLGLLYNSMLTLEGLRLIN